METTEFIKIAKNKAIKNKDSIERWINKLNSPLGKKRRKHYAGCLLRALGYKHKEAYRSTTLYYTYDWWDTPYLHKGDIVVNTSKEEFETELFRLTSLSEEPLQEKTFPEVINKKIKTTQEVLPGYLEKTAEMRHPETGCGSICTSFKGEKIKKGDSIIDLLTKVDDWEKYWNKNIMPGCSAFKTRQIKGKLGVISLKKLHPNTILQMEDPKNTGFPMPVVFSKKYRKTNFTVLIYGEHEGKEVIYTFHPGDPIPSPQIKCEVTELTVAEAIRMGFTHAKIKQ